MGMSSSNSYQRIKSFIHTNLMQQNSPLPEGQIRREIESVKKTINVISLELFAKLLPKKDKLEPLTENDWSRIERELEAQFDVKVEFGALIEGETIGNRDKYWWSSERKQSVETYYWSRYKEYLSTRLNSDVVQTIDHDTDIVMDNIEDPNIATFNRYGMVVGHVQSGKTGNYSALVCKAADAGYKFIVVIAGGVNNLRDQTQARLNEYFVGQDMGVQVGVGKGALNRTKLPISLTTKEKDFNKQDADTNSQGINLDNISVPILLVIKKNTKTLANVISWLQSQYANQIGQHAMLLIDDESDYASINTKKEEDPTTINKRIRKLLGLFQKSVYVAYTATPYANIFIDHQVGHDELGQDLFPKDFIYALNAPTNYFGAEKIFLNGGGEHLIAINDYLTVFPAKHKKDLLVIELPKSLKVAIRHFVLNVAIRSLRGQASEHNSMLVHATRFTMVHQKIAGLIEKYVDEIKKPILAYGLLENALTASSMVVEVKETFDEHLSNTEVSWQEVIQMLTKVIETVVVREVHQSTSVPLVYRNDIQTNAIVVGGTSLSRGFTLEGLSISYFLRNTVFYDTLMQMGRWFGYRIGYEDLCKIFLPETSIDHFGHIIDATNDLMDDLKRMAVEKMTPSDFGLAVKYHPDSGLQVTARNKSKNIATIDHSMNLDGHLKETAWLHADQALSNQNLLLIVDTLKKLNQENKPEKKGSRFLWSRVNRELIVDFLSKFNIVGSDDELGVRTRMPIKFILGYAEKMDLDWDVALYSGEGDDFPIDSAFKITKELRQIFPKHNHYEVNNRRVATGGAEAVSLAEDVRKMIGSKPKPKDIRAKMQRPLLMLHVLQNKNATPQDNGNAFAAFGVSFPGGINSGFQTIRMKINTVYIDNMKEAFEDGDYDD